MASITKRGNAWQVRIENKILPKTIFATFDSEPEAAAYARYIEDMLHRGVVPLELLERDLAKNGPKLDKLIYNFINDGKAAETDVATLKLLIAEVGKARTNEVTARWSDAWIRDMKQIDHKAPGTIRKRVGALARVLDDYIRNMTKHGDVAVANPLRMLPAGYSQYNKADASSLREMGREVKTDVSRDRRLHPDEVQRIRAALLGEKNPLRQRPLAIDHEFLLFFDLILNHGLRLRETYRLRCDQIDTSKYLMRVEGSKGKAGTLKPRAVPIVPALRSRIAAFISGRDGLVFSFWDGDAADESLKLTTGRLSQRFSALFRYVAVDDLTEHDLRHEACCRWITMKALSGVGWAWSEVEICKILGWTDTKMFLRYASLRGEDLADRMG